MLRPPDPTVPPVGKVDDALEFDKGYGAELPGVTPDVPPVDKAVPVIEAGLGRLLPVGPGAGRVELIRG